MNRRGLLARSLAVAVALHATGVAADAPTPAQLTEARERFAAARKLEDTGRWAEALALFQRVAEVKMTPQVRFHLGLCWENVGLWTQALEAYAQAASEAGAAAPEVVKEANEHARKLEASMPTVSLAVAGAAPGDVLLLDRRAIPIDGPLAIRVDPGGHTAEVRRGAVVVAHQSFAVEARATRRVELRVEPPPPVGPPPPVEPKSEPPPPDIITPPPVPARSDGRAQRIAGWSVVGVAGASLVVAGVFSGLRTGALHRLEGACPGLTRCSRTVAPIVAEGKTDAALVNVFAVAGALAAATGVTLLLTAPRGSASAARLSIAPLLGGLAVAAARDF